LLYQQRIFCSGGLRIDISLNNGWTESAKKKKKGFSFGFVTRAIKRFV